MKCPFYEETRMRYCKVFEKKIMIPSRSGKEKYCTCKDYLKCPVYIEHIQEKKESLKRQKVRKE
ncbi:MAG: hypothetical protein ACE5WD_12725 [Candidatus Aminicenantia bacterium]